MSSGDRNSKYFHSLLKSRQHTSRIQSVCDENGVKYEGKEMTGKFVEHFEMFLCA